MWSLSWAETSFEKYQVQKGEVISTEFLINKTILFSRIQNDQLEHQWNYLSITSTELI